MLNGAAILLRHRDGIRTTDVFAQHTAVVDDERPLIVGYRHVGHRRGCAQKLRQQLLIFAHVADFDSKSARERRKRRQFTERRLRPLELVDEFWHAETSNFIEIAQSHAAARQRRRIRSVPVIFDARAEFFDSRYV